MSKKLPIVLSVISICISLVCLVLMLFGPKPPKEDPGQAQSQQEQESADVQYVMYVGTNDKDTYAPKYTEEEALEIVDNICLKYFEGYTIQEATGSWTDETETKTHEYTIVCIFDGADEATVHAAADEIITALNQNTILIESSLLKTEYYSGNN